MVMRLRPAILTHPVDTANVKTWPTSAMPHWKWYIVATLQSGCHIDQDLLDFRALSPNGYVNFTSALHGLYQSTTELPISLTLTITPNLWNDEFWNLINFSVVRSLIIPHISRIRIHP